MRARRGISLSLQVEAYAIGQQVEIVWGGPDEKSDPDAAATATAASGSAAASKSGDGAPAAAAATKPSGGGAKARAVIVATIVRVHDPLLSKPARRARVKASGGVAVVDDPENGGAGGGGAAAGGGGGAAAGGGGGADGGAGGAGAAASQIKGSYTVLARGAVFSFTESRAASATGGGFGVGMASAGGDKFYKVSSRDGVAHTRIVASLNLYESLSCAATRDLGLLWFACERWRVRHVFISSLLHCRFPNC